MAQVIVRNVEEQLKLALKERAKHHGHSMEEELRQILRQALNQPIDETLKLGSRIAARFSKQGLTEPLPELRGQSIEPLAFGRPQ